MTVVNYIHKATLFECWVQLAISFMSILIGYSSCRYHTHPFSPPLPSLRDIDSQLEYELKMKGSNDASYTPCIGLIVC